MVRAAKRKVHRFHRAEKVLASMPAQAAQTQRSTIAGDAPHALTLAATSLGFVVVQLGVTIVNVALQRIGDAMGSGIAGLQWVVNAYTVVFASLVLTAGTVGDRIGAKRVFTAGFGIFTVASLACGFALISSR
jgi:MFS transporter, DHA2 family, methylenomycin A resistance protein